MQFPKEALVLADNLYRIKSQKNTTGFIEDLSRAVIKNGFVIHNESTVEMAHSFGMHGVEVAAGLDLHIR